jgi:TonB family protein
MPDALLLSPDDQAVSAISAVLEEMSVTCDRPLNGVSAAQKLNSQRFDLVLVDCENLPAAKLIFDVCRRGKGGHNPVPIAIVDGRAGLPTAFRLGAELILTKPVAKDQARSTIRTAISRVRKDVPADNSAAQSNQIMSGEMAQAAAASSQPSKSWDSMSGVLPATASTADVSATMSAGAAATKTDSSADEIEAVPNGLNPASASEAFSLEYDQRASSVNSKIARLIKPSGDPATADIDDEPEATASTQPEIVESNPDTSSSEQTEPRKLAAVDRKDEKKDKEISSTYDPNPRAKRAPLVALVMLLCAVGGFFAAWTYQPGFREIAEPQVDRLLEKLGLLSPSPSSAKPTAQVEHASPVVQQSDANLDGTKPALSDTSEKTAVVASVPVSSAQPAASSAGSALVPAAAATAPVADAITNAATGKLSNSKPNIKDSKPGAATSAWSASTSNATLPGESAAIILSSKGAEKRLSYSVPPKYPVDAGAVDAQGTVVLKTVVDENGDVTGVRIVDGKTILANAALQAVKQWRYRPYVRDGKARPFQTIVIVDFQRP